MSWRDESPSLFAQVKRLCREYPQAPKCILVPRTQIGRALEEALARDLEGWGGVTGRIVRHYAERLARPVIIASGRAELPVGGRPFLAARLIGDRGEEASALPGDHRVAGTVGEAIETLRRGGATFDHVQERAQSPEASGTFRVVATCYEAYLDTLEEEALHDDAQVFQWAARRLREQEVPSVSQSVVAVCNSVDLPKRAYQFVRAVRSACRAFYRLGRPRPQGAPPRTAAARFAEVPPPDLDASASDGSGPLHTRRAVGAANEVRAVFRDVLARDVPLDQIEIAFAGERPYVSLIADQAERMDVPVSIGTGVPASRTRTGKALLSFLEWRTDDFEAEVLIRALRSGHLRLDRIHSEIEEEIGAVDLDAHEVATLLAEHRYESGRDGYGKALGAAVRSAQERIETLEDKGLNPHRERERRRHLVFTKRVVDELLELAPRAASVQTMAKKIQQFIERFGPVEKPPEEKPEAERTLEEAARSVLWQRVHKLTRLPIEYDAPGVQLSALFRRWVERQYVRAEHPRPGTAHVVPLESAGYGGRSHLYIVGMDGETLSTAAPENALLHDADRQALNESVEGGLPGGHSEPDESLWRYREALSRHSGTLFLYSRVFDLDSGEERYPSPLFLRLEEGADDDPSTASSDGSGPRIEGFLPESDGPLLHDAEGWLAAYRDRGAGASGERTARSELEERYPWIRRGEEARQARQSATYTQHDGLLKAGDYPNLDFLRADYEGPPMSAGRLETFAETPYLYFLTYILGVEPLDEPALEDEPWLNHRRRGRLLHATFESFMETLAERGERPRPEHEWLLQDLLESQLEQEIETVAPPSEVVAEAARRQLLEDARLFLRSEVEHCREHEPLHFEVGFGYGPYRRRTKDLGSVALAVGDAAVPLRGRIDRVDRKKEGELAVWDYKTGRPSSFEDGDPLDNGAQLQWALYAYALEALTGTSVSESGYYFPSADGLGTRLAFDPARYRQAVDDVILRLGRLARTGSFPMNPRARYLNAWKYRGYEQLFRDLPTRSARLGEKGYPEERPDPLFD